MILKSGRLLVSAGLLLVAGAGVSAADLKAILDPLPSAKVRSLPQAPGPVSSPSSLKGGASESVGDSSFLLSEDLLLRAIQLDIPKRFPIKGELRVRLARPWLPMKLPAQDFFAECVQLPSSGISSAMAVTVRGVSGGQIIGEWPILLRAELWQEVWVAFERLERGTVLSPGMLVPQKIDLLKEFGPHPMSSETDLAGFELDQAVPAGKPLRKKDLVERSLIRKGQFVDAVANEGGLNIRMRAMALEGGAAGAVIRVRNLDSNREFVGQVLNETQVQVRF